MVGERRPNRVLISGGRRSRPERTPQNRALRHARTSHAAAGHGDAGLEARQGLDSAWAHPGSEEMNPQISQIAQKEHERDLRTDALIEAQIINCR